MDQQLTPIMRYGDGASSMEMLQYSGTELKTSQNPSGHPNPFIRIFFNQHRFMGLRCETNYHCCCFGSGCCFGSCFCLGSSGGGGVICPGSYGEGCHLSCGAWQAPESGCDGGEGFGPCEGGNPAPGACCHTPLHGPDSEEPAEP